MQNTAGQRLHLRCFLEGIEVPVISASVSMALNSPATASIQLIPLDSALDFKARTMVHLFYWDFDEDPAMAAVLNTNAKRGGGVGSTDPELLGYKLLFMGELVALSFVKTPSSRQLVIQCADFSTYWDTTYQIMVSYGPSGNFLWEQSAVWAGGSSMFDNILGGHGMTLASYINRKPQMKGLQNVKGLMGGIISLLEAMGGVPNHSHGVNDFFTIAEIKNHILQQICCEQNDDTAARLFSGKQFWEWLMGGGGGLGELCTFRDMLMMLFRYIYYEVVPVTCPMYIPAQGATASTANVKTGGGAITIPGNGAAELAQMHLEASHFASNSTYFSAEVQKQKAIEFNRRISGYLQNPEWPKIVKNLLVRSTNYLQVFGSMAANPKAWKKFADLIAKAANLKNYPTGSRAVTKKQGATLDRINGQIFRPDCFFSAPPQCNVLFPENYMQFSYSRSHLQEITRLRLALGWFLNPSGEGILGEQVFAPTTTELRAIAKSQGNTSIRALLPWEMYSGILPKFEKVNDINYVSNKKDRQMKKGVTGAAASYASRVANWNYLKYRFAARSSEVVAKFAPRFILGFPALVIERPYIVEPKLIQQAYSAAAITSLKGVQNDDFLARFKAILKHLSAVGSVPPTNYLGMCAALSHNVDQKGGISSMSLTHARTHRITEDDFLNIFSKQKSKKSKGLISTRLSATELLSKGDYTGLKMLIEATPQSGIIQGAAPAAAIPATSVTSRPGSSPNIKGIPGDDILDPFDLDQAFTLFELPAVANTPPPAPPFGVNNPGGFGQAPLRGPTAVGTLPGSQQAITTPSSPLTLKKGPKKGKVLAVELQSDAILKLNPAELGRFKDLKKKAAKTDTYVWLQAVIWEEIDITGNYERDIPVEESLRPPWMSPLYSSLFIGDEVYRPFFGCGSIVDEAVFAGAGTVGIFGSNRTERDKIMAQFKAANNDMDKIRILVDQAKANNLADIPSVETAADALAYVYGEVRRLGLDIHKFVADYTRRPIATMFDIFGSADLEYQQQGNKLKLMKGTQGFHSTSVAEFNQLVGLLDNPSLELPRLFNNSKKVPISKDLDPRPGRRKAVMKYATELQQGRGSLGSGLRG
jgi:hypothetical protein